ncbi:MAG TPA: Fe-S cluster assembly ATPase SufC, partial [Planctomycetes bacterium]|nr:Fe-S cluster assembly ATPase SufC [Planctomycetota bacterium]
RADDRAIVVVTHYQRLLDHIIPDHVHVLSGGRIVRSGDKTLAQELERDGYAGLGVDDARAGSRT